MKTIVLYLILLSTHVYAQLLPIDVMQTYSKASPSMQFYADVNDLMTISTIDKANWQDMTTTNLGTSNHHYTWTRFFLHNPHDSSQHLVLKNPRPGMDEIDVYIKRGQNIQHIALGDKRDIKERTIPHRYSVFPLTLQGGETVEIISKLINHIGASDGEWEIYSNHQFTLFGLWESLWWGLNIGFTLALLAYSIPAFLGSKDKLLTFFFSAHIISALVFQMGFNGTLYILYVNPDYISNIIILSVILLGFFNVLVILRFLAIINHKRGSVWYGMLSILFLLMIDFGLLVLSIYDIVLFQHMAYFNITLELLRCIVWFSFLHQIISLSHKKIFYYLFSGYTMMFIPYFVFVLYSSGLIQNNVIVTYGFSVGILLETYFYSLGLTQYIRKLEYTKINQEKLIKLQMRFTSIGSIIGNIAHQWKVPLMRAGVLLAETEAMIHLKKETALSEIQHNIIPQLRESHNFMQNTIDEFYALYRHTTQKTIFNPYHSLYNVWNMLSARAINANIKLEVIDRQDIEIENYEHHFCHLLMIILDNAINIAHKRQIAQSSIFVSIQKEAEKLLVTIEDTCGGIEQALIKSIFHSTTFTHESAPEYEGMGLFIFKTLLEVKFAGLATVSNASQGAKFEIAIPLYPPSVNF